MLQRDYQRDYSLSNPEMHSSDGRRRKAETMRLVLGEVLGARLAQSDVLNLGCSTGIIDEHIARFVRSIVGADIDEPAIRAAQARNLPDNIRFLVADAMDLALPDESFDIVICSQVYEHVPDADRLMAEIRRVLRPGGVCYFAATNRWSLIEQHYKLPFLSWLPQSMANQYVRLLGRSDAYYEKHLGVAGLRRLAQGLRIDDWTGRILDQPERYGAAYLFPGRASRTIARAMLRLAYPFFPGVIWLLWKPAPPSKCA